MLIIASIILISMILISSLMNKKIPYSISEIAYIFPKWLFTILILGLCILVMPNTLDALNDNYKFIAFFIMFGLWCVAASPYYKTDKSFFHYMGAIICFISMLCVIISINPLYLLCWVIYPICLIKPLRPWWLMIAECICFLNFVITLILN